MTESTTTKHNWRQLTIRHISDVELEYAHSVRSLITHCINAMREVVDQPDKCNTFIQRIDVEGFHGIQIQLMDLRAREELVRDGLAEISDTDRLDYLMKAFLAGDDDACANIGGALYMGKEGREAIDLAMTGGVPDDVKRIVLSLKGNI